MKKLISIMSFMLLFAVAPAIANTNVAVTQQSDFNSTPPGVLRGSAYSDGRWLSFYADDYSTTEILGTEINGDFWVTDGYFYTVGSTQYVNATIYTASGIIYYNGPIN